MWTEARWTKRTRSKDAVITGRYMYDWAKQRYHVQLNKIDTFTKSKQIFVVYGELPEWNNWRLVNEQPKL